MKRRGGDLTRRLTWEYLLALGLVAVLAIANYFLLRTEIVGSRTMASILDNSGRQRISLYRSALLAERLVFASDSEVRAPLRRELTAVVESLEETHFQLMHPGSTRKAARQRIRAIYENTPWLLDSEMRNYVLHVRAISKAPDQQLHFGNAHFRYVRDTETIDRILNGLDAVVNVYEQTSQAKTSQLQLLAVWTLASMLTLLLLVGWIVFRPMVRRVRQDVEHLNQLNETLDQRVAERTAEANRRAEQLAQSEAAVRNSEALYRSLVDNLPMCVLRKDSSGRFTFANDRFCQLVGKPLNQIIGCCDVDLYPPALAGKYQDDDRRVMKSARVLHDVEQHQAPGGRELFVEVIKAPLRDATGQVIGTQTVFWDVTDRMRAEQRARHAERLAAIGQMVAGVAHESRNALQQIQACTQLLEWELDGDASTRELLVDLQMALDRLCRLFNELREYASPLRLNVRRCSVGSVLEQAWSAVLLLRQGRDASLRNLSPATNLLCHADPFQLEQVFRNVLENALAACSDPVRIDVDYHRVQMDGQEVLSIAIRDNGPGLTEEQQARIFEPFFTTKTQGTGLGMAIVKQIVEGHGGRITARRADGQGTEILIILPATENRSAVKGRSVEECHV